MIWPRSHRALSSLHPRVRWVAPVLQVLDMNDRDLYLDGRGIELQPSAFCWQVPTKLRDPELKPILVYPIQHAPGILRQASMESAPRSDPLGSLLGSTRAVALDATDWQLQISGRASHQATVLREAGHHRAPVRTRSPAGSALRPDSRPGDGLDPAPPHAGRRLAPPRPSAQRAGRSQSL